MPNDSPPLVFMGTPGFAVPSLEALIEAGLPPAAVVTVPDKPAGRGQSVRASAVKKVAVSHGLPVMQPESLQDESFHKELASLKPEVIVVVAFRILPPEVYETARLGAFNLHASLLPAFRGAAPIQRALMAGVAETGVTTFFLQPKVDTGDVILQRRVSVDPNETAGELHDRLAEVGAKAVVETVRRILRGKANPQPQDEALASPAPKLFREDAEIDWDRPARVVHNHIRGTSPIPGAWTTFERGDADETLKIYRSEVTNGSGAPGEVIESGDRFVVACREKALSLTEIQREGKRRMNAADFLNGTPFVEGACLGGI